MREWTEHKLRDVAELNTDSIGKDYAFSEIQYLDTGSITQNKIEGFQKFSIADAPSRARRLVQKNDIIYSTVRPIQKHFGYIEDAIPDLVVSTGFAVIRPNPSKVNPKFLYYFLALDDTVNMLDMIAEGSTSAYPSLRPDDIGDLEITLPTISQQKIIAEIISSIDNKIDLLHRQSKTLEQLAETLFRQWFVEDSIIAHERQLILGDLIESVSITHKFPKDEVVFLNTSDVYKGEVLIHDSVLVSTLPGQAKKSIKKDDILFSEIRPANGRYAYIDFQADQYVVSTKLMVLRSKNVVSQSFIYFYLTCSPTINWLAMLAESRSGTFPQITFDQLVDLKINVPSEEILNDVITWCEETIKKIKANAKQIRTLTQLRDTLLPKLMSGEVQIETQEKSK